MNTTTATVAAAIDPSPLGTSVPATTAAQPTTTVHVTTTVPPVRGPFVVAHYLDIPRSSPRLEVVPVAELGKVEPIILDGFSHLESDGAGGVVYGKFNDPVVWHWPSGASQPRPVGEIPDDAIGARWSLGFIDDEPVLLVVSDNWRESSFGWCDGEPCFGDEGYQMGSGDRIVSLMRVSDGQVIDAHRESFVIGLSGAPNQLTHSFVSGGDTVAFVRLLDPSAATLTPEIETTLECTQIEFRTLSDELVSVPSNPYGACAPAWPDVNLVGLDRQGQVMVYEESKSGARQVVAINLDDGTELLRLQTWRLPDEPVGAFWVDFDPTGIVTVLWADTESVDMYTEIIDLRGGRIALPWPPADHPRGIPTVSYLPATDVDLTRLVVP